MKHRKILLALLLSILLLHLSPDVLATGDYLYQNDGTGVSIVGYVGQSNELNIPAQIDGKPVLSISKEAFMNNGRIVKVVLPDGLIRIGASAFQGAKYLEEVLLPASVRIIEQSAFNSCGNLKSIAIPYGVKVIDKNTFLNCKKLAEVSLPASIEAINEKGFAVTGLVKVDLPFGLQTIGEHAFYGCRNLVEVTLPNTIKNIDQYAFFVCDNLKSVILPTSLQSMSSGIFDKCPNLETIAIPMTVKNIRNDALFSSNLRPQKLTIITPSGSMAEKYAKQAGISCEPTAKTSAVSITLNGREMSDQKWAIDLSSDIKTLDMQALTSPETLWPGVVWKSSNGQIASVDSYGHIIANKKGEAVISAIAADGSGAQASFTLNIANLAKSIVITGSDSLYSKGKITLKAAVLPETADNRNVDWLSSNPSVVSITNKGLVKAEAVAQKQSVMLTATARDGSGVTAAHELTVFPLVEEVRIMRDGQILENKSTLSIDLASQSHTIQLLVDNYPSDSMQKMKWESSSKRVAQVDENGLITGLKRGKAVITASTIDGTRKKVALNVIVSTLVKDIIISGNNAVASEQKLKLSAAVLPEEATDKKILWSSSDETIARVNKNSGEISARKVDTMKKVIITAAARDGSQKAAQIEVTVHPAATELRMARNDALLENKAALTLSLSDVNEIQLTASVLPSDAMQSVNWKSSDERIAQIDNAGKVTLLRKGNVRVTVSSTDGSRIKAYVDLLITE